MSTNTASVEPVQGQPDPSDAHVAEVIAGLSLPQKTLSPKFFYDERGSRLFDEITRLPEYYPTRTELSIMQNHIDEIADCVGPRASLIEFGSGSSLKIRILIDHLESLAAYVPVDISTEHLARAVDDLAIDYPDLDIRAVSADFTKPFELPQPSVMPLRNIVYFPGSTIGNFAPAAALDLLKVMRGIAKDGGGLLIGVDLKKDRDMLERAYNDAAGVTAEFNRNMLRNLNALCGADFAPEAFRHRAVYRESLGRIEMHLISERQQQVHVAGRTFSFGEGEYILTECSHKYSTDEFAALAQQAGFRVARVWTDSGNLFSIQYCESE
jgi:dimethylhistidine N-methyltransferase